MIVTIIGCGALLAYAALQFVALCDKNLNSESRFKAQCLSAFYILIAAICFK